MERVSRTAEHLSTQTRHHVERLQEVEKALQFHNDVLQILLESLQTGPAVQQGDSGDMIGSIIELGELQLRISNLYQKLTEIEILVAQAYDTAGRIVEVAQENDAPPTPDGTMQQEA